MVGNKKGKKLPAVLMLIGAVAIIVIIKLLQTPMNDQKYIQRAENSLRAGFYDEALATAQLISNDREREDFINNYNLTLYNEALLSIKNNNVQSARDRLDNITDSKLREELQQQLAEIDSPEED